MQTTIHHIRKELAELYSETELQGFIRLIFESVCGWSYTEQILNKGEKLDAQKTQKIEAIIQGLKMHEPIQYILGETEFYGLNLKVTSSVLIPRPETEELVQWIIENNSIDSPRILDIGSGSGCIALALKNQIKDASVSGADISEDALEVAKQNAHLNKLEVNFLLADILNWENYNWEMFDIIVSNPPYVREIDKQKMHTNVLEHEPKNALFVSDENPLVFYRRIVRFAQKYLLKGGTLFFEINEYLSDEMFKLLMDNEFKNIELRKDINSKNRMIFCKKN